MMVATFVPRETDECLLVAIRLREEGKSASEIAERLGKSGQHWRRAISRVWKDYGAFE